MHKTGTSFLQKQIFPNLKDVLYSRRFNLRDYYKTEGSSILISDEILSGNPFDENTMNDFEMKMDVLKSLFPNAAILVSFREPVGYILSLYKQFLHQGGTISFNEFFNADNTGVLKIEDLNYLKRLNIIENNFSNVIAYDFETFRSNPDSIYNEVCRILKTEMPDLQNSKSTNNVSIRSKWQVNTLKTLNRFFGFTYKTSFYRRLGLTPRNLIQNKLAFIKGEKWDLAKSEKNDIKSIFIEDWMGIKKRLL